MPAILVALVSILAQAAGTLVGRVMMALGFTLVTFTGFQLVTDQARGFIEDGFDGLTGDVAQIVAMTQVDVAITMVLSAYAARAIIKGLQGGSVRRWVG